MAICGHHKRLKNIDRSKSVNFVLFMGSLQCEFKSSMSSLAHKFPFQTARLDWPQLGHRVCIEFIGKSEFKPFVCGPRYTYSVHKNLIHPSCQFMLSGFEISLWEDR